ncbi:nck-associated protein 5-like [Megalops cyprinoides]|uniref:nck-associated protein 5-like n=1 Tax=Megalops cyprinoides TaxID=118141 RepID=UPI001864C906|nr:nck-associated protein 5-like [Megalops cyprinoides]
MMSEEAELRDCDEAFESEEGEVEPYLEEGESSRELLERLRELEAENSALALANESQREAYERCLDEVANHVVQALLNQKDLREECIKLKMRVFDLERQNRTLTELFHQKIHNQPGPSLQMQTGPIPEQGTMTPPTGSDKPAESPCDTPIKSTGEHTKNGTPGTQGPAASMEALSPFFKKKAHILEVLRKLEETDPLKFHPSSGLSSYCDFSQTLVPAEMGLASVSLPPQHKAVHQPHCRHSCSDSDAHEYINGKGAGPDDHRPCQESCQSCLILSQKNLDSLLKCNLICGTSHPAVVGNLDGLEWPEAKGVSGQSADSQSDTTPAGSTSQPHTHSTSAGECTSPAEHRHKEPEDLPQLGVADSHIKDTGQNSPTTGVSEGPPQLGESQNGAHQPQETFSDTPFSTTNPAQCKLPPRDADALPLKEDMKHMSAVTLQSLNTGPVMETTEECYFKVAAEVANVKNSLYAATSNLPVPVRADSTQIAYCEQETKEQICNGLYFSSNESCMSKKVAVESYSPATPSEKGTMAQLPPAGKGKLVLSPTSPSCLSEVKASPISSPSRLLKFLKIPSIGERGQGSNPLRLSPQLTRSSRIPCRNNYEVFHSPAAARKATTTERDRQPTPSKTDPYPATHSAPTSPPKPEGACSPPAKEISYSSHSAPKASRSTKLTPSAQQPKGFQKVPLYENVSDLSVSCPVDGDEAPQFLERLKASRLVPYPKNEDALLEKRPSSLEEGLLGPGLKQHDLLLGTDCSRGPASADHDASTDNDGWYQLHSHHSLPDSAALHKAQNSCHHPSTTDRQHDPGALDTTLPSSELSQSPAITKGTDPPTVPKKSAAGKPHSESSHHAFKERLAALGKLKSTEDLQVSMQSKDKEDTVQWNESKAEKSKTAERQVDRNAGEHRHSKYTDSLDGKPYPKANLSGYAGKFPGPSLPYELGAKSLPSGSSVTKVEQETFSSRMCVTKTESPKIKAGLQPSNPDPPQVLRNYMKCAATPSQNLPHNGKNAPSPQSSPTKVQSKSPSKPGQASSNPRTCKPIQEDRAAAQKLWSKSEDRSKLAANKKKSSAYSESLPPPPSRPVDMDEDKRTFTPGPQSAIEQKVMKGIEENVLKLQEQDRGQAAEVKQKATNGIASWFGLRKSKLPALSRKLETSKPKEDRKEWRLVSSSAGRDPKAAAKKKLEVESLNISKLMEKAEDLRKALEEERAYVNGVALDRPGRGHSCEVVMNQAQGQLSVMYRGVASDNFMQQLLNRVDVRDGSSMALAHRRLSFDSKKSRPVFSQPRNGIISHAKSREDMEKGSDLVSKDDVTADESLAESMNSQHFAGCSASTHTLDSGIGTFPLPDYSGSAAGKSIPKVRPRGERDSSGSHGKPGPTTKVPRKARTLERELTSLEEDCPREKELNSSALYGPAVDSRGPSTRLSSTIREDDDTFGEHMRSPPSKNWTFPNLKVSEDPTEVYLGVTEGVEPAPHGTPFRRSLKPCGPPGPCDTDPASLSLPPQVGLGHRGKGRTPSAPEVGKEAGLELVKERQDDVLSPIRPQALETPESLSDSLYDSLSSCGSQG